MSLSLQNRYSVVAGAFITQSVVIGGMFAYGVFFTELEAELGWSRTLLSATTSLSFLVMGILAVVGGWLSDRIGPRWVLTGSGLCYGLGYALMSTVQVPWQLFLFFGLLIGIGLSTHDVVTLSTVARWFERRRGMMTGVVKVGTACGQIILPLLAALLIASFGWRSACLVLGLGAALLLLLAAQAVRQPATTTSVADTSQPRGPGFAEVARSRPFITLCAVQFMFLPSLMTIPLHVVPHAIDLGLPATAAAAVLSTIGAVSIIGRLFVGAMIDRIGGRRALLLSLSLLLLSLLWLRVAVEPWALFAFAALYGLGHGGLFTAVSPTVAEFFGTTVHGSLFGTILFFGTLGGALGPLLAGAVFDIRGSYDLAFTVLAVMALIAVVLVASLRPAVRETAVA